MIKDSGDRTQFESGEAAYQQELRDRDMREVYGDKAVSFSERYSEILEIKW